MYHKLSIFILFLLITASGLAQAGQKEPHQLVVGIKIDGLQTAHLHKMWKYFTPGGFRKIVSESMATELRHITVSAGNAADAATFATGTFPSFHGVTGDLYFDSSHSQLLSVLYDKNQTGIGTSEKFSAHKLLASTFTDELMLAYPYSQVHSIGINAEDAIMMGGHAATSVSWIDDSAGKWVTTAYYTKGLSRWADMQNVDGTFKQASSEKWVPSATISTFQNPTLKGSRTVPFNYDPADKKENGTARFMLKKSPAANTLVTELAKTIFEKEHLGTDKNPDVLMLQYTVKIPAQSITPLSTAEQEDMYIRLDRNLQTLLSTIVSKIGSDKLLVFLVGTSGEALSHVELNKNSIPSGLFNADRALALLNTYLMAVYGQENWISGYYGKNIFLNKKIIESKKIDINEFSNRAAGFMMEFEGVQSAYTADFISRFSGDETDVRTKLHNSQHRNNTPDIMITLMPGWTEVDKTGKVVDYSNAPQVFVPFYIMGKGLKAQQLPEIYNTTDIAPTISDLLGIPYPNACMGKKIGELP